MSDIERTKQKQDAKRYIEQLYTQHREDDIDSWSHLIDVIWMYIDAVIDEHEKATNAETKE